jgi:hypothetical protein
MEALQKLLEQLEVQEELKYDAIIAPSAIHFLNGKLIVTDKKSEVIFTPTDHFHAQMADKMGIPLPYYKRLFSDPANMPLLDTNVNHWLSQYDKNLLVRMFKNAKDAADNSARALLSDGYKIMDNYPVLMEALEAIKDSGVRVEIKAAELSNTRMYLSVVAPDVEVNAKAMLSEYRLSAKAGTTGVISGFTLSNSEIGAGSFSITPRAVILACNNGAIRTEDRLRNVHLGAKMDELGFNQNKSVMRANQKLVREQIIHAVKIFLSKDYLQKLVDVYEKLGQPKIEAPIGNLITVVAKEYKISEDRKANILQHFVEGGDMRRIGLANAITRECQGLEDADLKNDSEEVAYDVLKHFTKYEVAASKIKNSAS